MASSEPHADPPVMEVLEDKKNHFQKTIVWTVIGISWGAASYSYAGSIIGTTLGMISSINLVYALCFCFVFVMFELVCFCKCAQDSILYIPFSLPFHY